jgi:Methyltransferase domain
MSDLPQAVFVDRTTCINCGGARLREQSRGKFSQEPLRGFLAADPWGTDPLPHLARAEWCLVVCDDCSQLFHKHILDEHWNERRFSEWMSAEAIAAFEIRVGAKSPGGIFQRATRHVEHVLRIEQLTRELRGKDAVRLLDFGCGWGEFLEACQHFGFDCIGVDRSTGRRSRAVVTIEPSLTNVKGPFHALTLFETLEHLDDPAGMLRILNPLVVPGGVLVLETPDCAGVQSIASHRDYLLVHPLEHINGFTHQSLIAIAERCGFKPISRPATFVTTALERVTRNVVKAAIGKGEKSTQLYFRKSA